MNDKPLVSICIPNYNNERTLRKTLDSLVNQTYKNVQIKLFDNASTDNSLEILKEYEKKYPNIKVFKNETNIGGEANFNKCIEHLEGEFGALYHSDDIYSPTIIEEQVEFLLNNKECIAVSTDMSLINENEEIQKYCQLDSLFGNIKYKIIDNQLQMLKIVLEIGNFIICPTVMIRTDIYQNKIKKYDYDNFKTASDFDIWFRVLEYGKFGVILKPLIKYRKSSNSHSFRNKLDINESDGIKVLRYYYNKYNASLSNLEKRKYNFSLFRDKVTKTVNQILVNDRNYKFDIEIFNLNIFLEALISKKNFQFFVVGCVVKLLRYFALPKLVREKLINLKFNNKRDI